MAKGSDTEIVPPWNDTDFRIVIGRTRIEYDSSKEQINRKKHSYSLASAVHFLERLVLPIPSPLFMTTDSFLEKNDVRHNHMTLDDDGHVVFFVTTMRSNETVRVISLRRAGDSERKLYTANAKALGYELPANK
jgi:uncharacterized DUF497 family protein